MSIQGFAGTRIPISPLITTGNFLFLSGQLALRDGRIEGDIAAQTSFILDGIKQTLESAGRTLDHVVKATIWIVDPADFEVFNQVYSKRFRAPYPARSCVVSQLVVPDALVEIEVIAADKPRADFDNRKG